VSLELSNLSDNPTANFSETKEVVVNELLPGRLERECLVREELHL
jgi:hypothetical protein